MGDVHHSERTALLHEAQSLANRGDVDEAMMACHRYLSLYEGTSEIFFLMGMLEVALRRDEEAIRNFQKAVYLEPSHYDGLVNLALLAARRGELDQAEKFWKRARKLSTIESKR